MSYWAYALAEPILASPLPQRWQHSQEAARRATELRPILGGDAELLATAALLHDLGYAPELAVTGFHALDGARYLRGFGMDERVVRLVAHHTCASVEAEERGLLEALSKFEPEEPLLRDALIYCDMHTTPDGRPTMVGERIAEITERYGTDSVVGRFIRRAEPELRAACGRIEARLREAGVQPM